MENDCLKSENTEQNRIGFGKLSRIDREKLVLWLFAYKNLNPRASRKEIAEAYLKEFNTVLGTRAQVSCENSAYFRELMEEQHLPAVKILGRACEEMAKDVIRLYRETEDSKVKVEILKLMLKGHLEALSYSV